MAWDKDKPAGSQKIRLSDEEIRANWAALEDALGREHTFPGVMGGTAGKHTPLIANLQKQLYTAAAAGGTVDAITATFDPPLGALTNNTLVCVIAAGANTTTTPTFAPDGLTAKTIVKGSNQALAAGDIPGANFPAFLQYNAVLTKWVLINPAYSVSVWKDKFALLQNRQTQNTNGGATTSGSWGIVPINTEQSDVDGIVDATALPAFSLQAGTYIIKAVTPFQNCGKSQTRLYNVTDAAAAIDGSNCSEGGYDVTQHSYLVGQITIAATKQFRLEYSVQTTRSTGFGYAGNFGPEVYAQVMITKIA
jgi:hypothetical protein